jgi:hypothetical protein
MGYPMTYGRVVSRNRLSGDYNANWQDDREKQALSLIRGDLRRLEKDQRDDQHLELYAKHAGVTPEQAKKVLDKFFDYGGFW